MIFITGASGQLGSAVVRNLSQLAPAAEIGALVRNENARQALGAEGIDVRLGNYDEPVSLERLSLASTGCCSSRPTGLSSSRASRSIAMRSTPRHGQASDMFITPASRREKNRQPTS